jgi:hypothetical protein
VTKPVLERSLTSVNFRSFFLISAQVRQSIAPIGHVFARVEQTFAHFTFIFARSTSFEAFFQKKGEPIYYE